MNILYGVPETKPRVNVENKCAVCGFPFVPSGSTEHEVCRDAIKRAEQRVRDAANIDDIVRALTARVYEMRDDLEGQRRHIATLQEANTALAKSRDALRAELDTIKLHSQTEQPELYAYGCQKCHHMGTVLSNVHRPRCEKCGGQVWTYSRTVSNQKEAVVTSKERVTLDPKRLATETKRAKKVLARKSKKKGKR